MLERYLDAIIIRTFAQADVEELAEHADIPVINGLTDYAHPCQALADLMTIRERLGRLSGVRLAYLGDGTTCASRSWSARARFGMRFVAATPTGYEPDADAVTAARRPRCRWAAPSSSSTTRARPPGSRRPLHRRLDEHGPGGGGRAAAATTSPATGSTTQLLALAAADAIVLHCLPAHYGEEITEEVLYGPQLGGLGPGREPAPLPEGAAGARSSRERVFPLKDNVPTRSFPLVTVGADRATSPSGSSTSSRNLDRSVVELAYQPCEVVSSCPAGTAVGQGWE